ncbi:N-acetylneuraminate 9-O-acetyltransferase isoform X1 [Salmo trutta]|uniref:N-acetylneuraminate (7)9-O-acetyltransferase n=2 Tax=Salmo trutta TaxID=8032 RepID=A0A674CV80_SALTR|nr:N-acetylneuraminate 9-O-acetyltransferase-like isoform X1 [Salmo trutta]XP_029588475.1 N-acetylneuraminate 9-O-acetyltransferase-like isoform X1 [Salmo trutta]
MMEDEKHMQVVAVAASEKPEPAMPHATTVAEFGVVDAPVCSAPYHSAASHLSACCHGGAKMAFLAYSLGKREINQYFSIKNAKLLSVAAVILLTLFHTVSRYYGGGDTCEWLLSSGRYLGETVWQPYGCMMHKYKNTEAKTCLADKRVAFVGDSRIRQLFYSYIQIIDAAQSADGRKHENIIFEDRSASVNVDFLWYAEVNNSLKERLISWRKDPSIKPDVVIIGAATWSIKLHGGSSEALQQYRANLTAISLPLEQLAEDGEVYWVLQDPVHEEGLSDNRKMITNEQLELYNKVVLSTLNSNKKNSKARVRFLGALRQAAMEAIAQSADGLHLPESTRNVAAMVLMNAVCNKVLRPTDGSCCQSLPAPSLLQKLMACVFLGSALVFLVLHALGHNRPWKSRPTPPDVESGEEKKPATAASPLNHKAPFQALSKMGLIMVYFYLCDRANVFMKEQKFYTHSTFFIPLIYMFVLGIFYSENSKETKLLNREQTDEWKGWMQLVILIYHISGASVFIPVYMHVRVLVAAYLFQTGYGHFSFFWLKGDFGLYRVCQVLFRLNFLVVVLCLVMDRPYQFYYFVPLVTFWFVVIYATMAMWPQIRQKKANGSGMWHVGILGKLLGLLLFICFFAYSQGLFENIFSVWPISKLFELNGSIHEWWFRWKLDRFAIIHGMLFAFVYLVLQKCQGLSEEKGEPLFSTRISNILLLISVVSFMTYSIWASSCKNKTECNELHPYISGLQILAFILIRNIPGYSRSLYSSFFAWFGKISLELFICQYHIWLAADTKGILVLIPGNPSLNIIISTFIFVCVAHEISVITNDLAQVAIPKDGGALLRRLLVAGVFTLGLLLVSRSAEGIQGGGH